MATDKTIEERVGINEQAREDCQKNYDGRFKAMEKRVSRLEYLLFGILATGLATLLSVWLKK